MMYTKKQDKFAATFEEKTKECPLYARKRQHVGFRKYGIQQEGNKHDKKI